MKKQNKVKILRDIVCLCVGIASIIIILWILLSNDVGRVYIEQNKFIRYTETLIGIIATYFLIKMVRELTKKLYSEKNEKTTNNNNRRRTN